MSLSRFFRFQAQLQLMPVLESGEEPTLVGGQAVLEGVMMRAPHSYCIAVRKADGSMVTDQKAIPRMSEKYPIFKYPILRGLGTLGQAMQLGFKSLNFSMNAALEDQAKCDAQAQGKPVKPVAPWIMTLNILFSVGFFLFMYKFVPLLLAERIASTRFAINMWDGVLRLAIFLTFLLVLSRMKDIRRVFEYHGAEHKVVFNFESGKPVNVENAQKFVTWHPRCGTSFLLVLMVIAMIFYALLPIDGFWTKFAARIASLPLIIGISYELIRFAARRQGSLLGLITAPGLWLQRVTTKPPDNAQAEVAIHALQGAMALEEKQGGELVIA